MVAAQFDVDPSTISGETRSRGEKIVRHLGTFDVPIDKLRQYPGNPRRGNIAVIKQSLRKHGQYKTIVAQADDPEHPENGGTVLGGNHTLMAAKELGWNTMRVDIWDVDDEQARAIVLVDNRTTDLADYDDRLLAELLAQVEDLDSTGYDLTDVKSLEIELEEGHKIELFDSDDGDDDAPTPPAEPHCKPGDVWQLGKHRLVVGDSTNPKTWDLLLGDRKADMIWTDPPYGISYQGKTKDALQIENDDLEGDALGDFLRGVLGIAFGVSKPGACWYVASPGGPNMNQFGVVLEELGIFRQTIIWVKDTFTLGRSDYHYRHEIIFYGWKPGAAHHAVPDRKQDTVHEFPRPSRSADHPTMKPIALIGRHIQNSTNPSDLVVDPFGGSGSTLLAAHKTGREAAIIELDPRYADVICRRYQQHSGELPTREGVPHDFVGESK